MEVVKQFRQTKQTIEGEYLKNLTEIGLHNMAKHYLGQTALEFMAGGKRIEDERLHCDMAGMQFENPVMVGAGWDKKGRAVDGLYLLGFSGTEVGSVLVYSQFGRPQPRLFIDKKTKSVGLNGFGFNSPGMEVVDKNLNGQNRYGITGISLGKNKLTPDKHAAWAYAEVAKYLSKYADFITINVTSQNTPGLINLLSKEPLTEIIQAVQEVLGKKNTVPLFVKTTVDLSLEDLDGVLSICDSEGVNGVIDTNTTTDNSIKALYGWQEKVGGVSGNDNTYRKKANERMKFITKQTLGTNLQRIGVGAIHDADTALERIQAGAQVVQVVTGIRQHKGRIARNINLGLLESMNRDGVNNISEYVGVAV